MSQPPDGIGQIGYTLKSNAGLHESGFPDDYTSTFASSGQEKRQQIYNLVDTTSSIVLQYDLLQEPQRPSAIEQRNIPIQIHYQQAEEPQIQPDEYAQESQPENYTELLNYVQTDLPIESYANELADQQQFQVSFDYNFHMPDGEQHQIPDHNQNLIEQATLAHSIPEPEEEHKFTSKENIPYYVEFPVEYDQFKFADQEKKLVAKPEQKQSVAEKQFILGIQKKELAFDLYQKEITHSKQLPRDGNRFGSANQDNLLLQQYQKLSSYLEQFPLQYSSAHQEEKLVLDQYQKLISYLQQFLAVQNRFRSANREKDIVLEEYQKLTSYLEQFLKAQYQFRSADQRKDLVLKQYVQLIYYLELFLGGENQLGSADQEEEELFVEQNQLEAENYPDPERVNFLLDFANCSDYAYYTEPETHSIPLESIAVNVHNSVTFLRKSCERLRAEPEPEQLEIIGLLALREKLINVCEQLIDDPHPGAWPVIEEVIRGTESVSIFDKKVGKVWTNINSIVQTDPMGLDLLTRIRKLITGWYNNDTKSEQEEAGSGSGPIGDQQQRNSRKRRIAEDEPPLIKYRRVDNSFPRFIPNEAAEDPLPNKSMAEREREKENQRQQACKRLSIFNAPTLTQQRVRSNASNINIDLSDDDEPVPSFGLGASYKPPAPTLRTSMNSDAATSNSSLPMRSQMLYSDAVRLGQNGFPESRMNGHPSPIRPPVHRVNSILDLENLRMEREHYLSLLRNVCHDQSSIRAINKSKPPPLQLLHKSADRSTTWGSILANNKPAPSRPQLLPPQQQPRPQPPRQQHYQQPPPPPPLKPVGSQPNREFLKYAKLLDREQQKNKPAPPPLKRLDSGSAKSITSHASTISISESTSSSSNSSTASDVVLANNVSSNVQAPAPRTSHTGASPSRTSDNDISTVYKLEMEKRKANCVYLRDNYADEFMERSDKRRKELACHRELVELQVEKTEKMRRDYEQSLRSRLFQFRIAHTPILVVEPIQYEDEIKEKKEPKFIPFTDEHMTQFNNLINGNPHQVVSSKFNLQITRNDIRTLLGSSWLNDEVINFYMNLLTERSEKRSGELPSVYAMNTFFVPRLLQNGHAGVKRWTRKVDLFSKDIIPVPVHCNGVHWCMAIIHMRNKTIRYYDSMGKPNQDVLDALESYLQQESLDKRKQPFDTSDFKIESVPNVPQQTNGSDCGVFSCMFAEYISRDAPITFSQENMDYFRKKMILEISDGKLWN
ncbi:uncharacterized protein LOC110181838 [Drosophila serrata]|uniref:uncharacterized protein LOC110181838 n=1 Tax=Drosophila serrata TaxID=7274 RepID=UPI000A1D2A5F|nr:uncharacterized protein LOC110181838 [Drosophila serrata]